MRRRDSRKGLQNRNDRVDVDSGLAADASQNLHAAQPREHRGGFAPANRCNRQRSVLHHLDQHSAEPHHHHRAKAIVAKRPGNQLDAGFRHRLHRHPFEVRVGGFDGEPLANSLERVAHRRFIADIQLDPADVALVTHVRRQHLQHHRESDSRRRPHRIVRRRCGIRHDDRQAQRMQNSLALDFR